MNHVKQFLRLVGLCLMAFGTPVLAQDSFSGGQRLPPASPANQAPQAPTTPQAQPVPVDRAPPAFEPSGPPPGPGAASPPTSELQDFGVPPTNRLHTGQMHGPTPVSVPGGKVVTTSDLAGLLRSGTGQYLLLDVLGGPEMLPNARQAVWLAQPGSFDDPVQQQAASAFQQATGGRKDMPIVLYCQSNHCWMSYNAALRAIAAGYTNVLWYRGGVEAWKSAGLPLFGGGSGPGAGSSQN
jgi:PQQ-dependent catabolism-associated CXXCW motif protein